MSRSVYEKIKQSRPLPTPTGLAMEILRLASEESTTVEELADLIETDPATTARILMFVNSPLVGVSRKIASVPQAVVLIGMQAVKSVALGFSLLTHCASGRCAGFDYEEFWSDCLARAVSARHISARTGFFPFDEAFTCGLLAKIGRLALATAFPEEYSKALSRSEGKKPTEVIEIEREMFEIDHNELSAQLMADWKLPDVLGQAVRRQDEPIEGKDQPETELEKLSHVLHLSGLFAPLLTQSVVPRESLVSMTREANRVDIKPEVLAGVFDITADEWQSMAWIFDVRTRKVPPLAEIYTLSVA